MFKPRKIRPLLEILEDRLVPAAALVFDGSGALIGINSNATTATLTVQLTANDTANVIVNGVPKPGGPFFTGSSLTINQATSFANPGPVITLDLNGFTLDLAGGFTVNAASAPFGDTVNIGGPTAAGFGTINGPVSVTTGNNTLGGDFVGVGVNAAVTIQGTLFVNTGAVLPGFSDVVDLGPAGATITSNVTILNATGLFSSGASIGGSMRIDSTGQLLQPASVNLFGTTINRNLTVTTGGLSDTVFLDLFTAVNGSATINLGNGGQPSGPPPIGDLLEFEATVLGNLTVQAGNGPEVIELFGIPGLTGIGGNLSVAVGAGQDSIGLSGLTVLGNTLKVTTGGGNNSVFIDHVLAPGAQMSVILGAGNDTVLFDISSVYVAGLLLDGGAGKNGLAQFGGPYHYPVTIRHFNTIVPPA